MGGPILRNEEREREIKEVDFFLCVPSFRNSFINDDEAAFLCQLSDDDGRAFRCFVVALFW